MLNWSSITTLLSTERSEVLLKIHGASRLAFRLSIYYVDRPSWDSVWRHNDECVKIFYSAFFLILWPFHFNLVFAVSGSQRVWIVRVNRSIPICLWRFGVRAKDILDSRGDEEEGVSKLADSMLLLEILSKLGLQLFTELLKCSYCSGRSKCNTEVQYDNEASIIPTKLMKIRGGFRVGSSLSKSSRNLVLFSGNANWSH